LQYISNAQIQHATVHLGGERSSNQGYWIDPTIITARSDMEFVKEEIFGPVAVIIKFENEDDILELEDNSLYGLTASFFTKDLTRGVQVANKLQAGTVWVNCMNTLYPNVPYGGFKQSGIGRECGQYALDTWVIYSPSVLALHETANPWALASACQVHQRQIGSNEHRR
jgi:aldehyde dehydrogenase (NAD+)